MQSSKPSVKTTEQSQPSALGSSKAGQQSGKVQGEGDYASNHRYTESAQAFVASGQVDAAARNAKPQSEQEAAALRKAEQDGASHAKGGQSSSNGKTGQAG